ncbi:MAG: hypothetical protein F6K36_27250 [Symploca sp. SIO3C6]|nr:hypothetical protein [Symploca sp. SIO3C6]
MPVGLEVLPGKTLALVGSEVALMGGNLKAAGGRIELGSVGSNSTVTLTPVEKGWTLGYEGVQNFQDIEFSQAASLRTSGPGAGALNIQGRSIILSQGSVILAFTLGSQPGENLTLRATDSLELSGSNAFGVPSFLQSNLNPEATGNAGKLTIETGRLILQDGALISSATGGKGKGGNINIHASESVELIGLDASGFGSTLVTQATLTAEGGNAGDLSIETGRLILQDGALVSSSTSGKGNGGNIDIRASESVELSGMRTDWHSE